MKTCNHDGCNNPVFSKGYCRYHAPRKPIAKKPYTIAKHSKKTDVQELVYECDYLFSRLIRQMNADKDGICKCFTCEHKDHWKDMQLGHYLPRKYYQTRWNYFLNRVQCKTCNEFKSGNINVFTQNLSKIDSNTLNTAIQYRNEVFKLTPSYLEEIKEMLIKDLKDNGYEY
jgi:hypothetical protein